MACAETPREASESLAPEAFVSALAGGKTANVLEATLTPGAVGVYEVQLELNSMKRSVR